MVYGFDFFAGLTCCFFGVAGLRMRSTFHVRITCGCLPLSIFTFGRYVVSFGAGISVNSVKVTSATAAVVNITVNPTAIIGSRAVTGQNSMGSYGELCGDTVSGKPKASLGWIRRIINLRFVVIYVDWDT